VLVGGVTDILATVILTLPLVVYVVAELTDTLKDPIRAGSSGKVHCQNHEEKYRGDLVAVLTLLCYFLTGEQHAYCILV
jgi:hypothetical protein